MAPGVPSIKYETPIALSVAIKVPSSETVTGVVFEVVYWASTKLTVIEIIKIVIMAICVILDLFTVTLS